MDSEIAEHPETSNTMASDQSGAVDYTTNNHIIGPNRLNWAGRSMKLEAVAKRLWGRSSGARPSMDIRGHAEDIKCLELAGSRHDLLAKVKVWTARNCETVTYQIPRSTTTVRDYKLKERLLDHSQHSADTNHIAATVEESEDNTAAITIANNMANATEHKKRSCKIDHGETSSKKAKTICQEQGEQPAREEHDFQGGLEDQMNSPSSPRNAPVPDLIEQAGSQMIARQPAEQQSDLLRPEPTLTQRLTPFTKDAVSSTDTNKSRLEEWQYIMTQQDEAEKEIGKLKQRIQDTEHEITRQDPGHINGLKVQTQRLKQKAELEMQKGVVKDLVGLEIQLLEGRLQQLRKKENDHE